MHTLMHLDILHHVDALTWWEFFIEILDYAYARPQGKGVACEKLGISHFVDDKIEANARSFFVWFLFCCLPKTLSESLNIAGSEVNL